MADRYPHVCDASRAAVTTALATEIDLAADGHALLIGDSKAPTYAIHGTAAELADLAARIGDAVLALAPNGHLTDAQLAEQLGAELFPPGAPDEEPSPVTAGAPLGAAQSKELAIFREVLADGYLAESAVQHFMCEEIEALIGMLDHNGRETWLRYHCTGDCEDLEIHGASEADVALWRVMNEPPVDEAGGP